MLAFAASPIKTPTNAGVKVAITELKDPPIWISWLPLLPPPQLEKIQWHIVVPANMTIRGDSSLLQVVFRNLLDNASKYSPSDSIVTVTADSDEESINLHFCNEIPIDSTIDAQRLADRFYRSPQHQQIEGAGLGLSIVRQIMHVHQGELSIKVKGSRHVCVMLHFPKPI